MKVIPVTKPFLPPKEEYDKYVNDIWKRNWLTNHGPLVQEFETRLAAFLNIPFSLFVTNGTIALQLAIKALELEGEIITTPFTYVATTSSIVWEGCTPIFADIDSTTLNIDASKIEKLITQHTTGIVATHVFGRPCDIDIIEKIAKKHNLKVIFDAAHAFGVKYKGKSIFEYGDISITSFHATKLLHSTEGGGLFTKSEKIHNKLRLLRNFGHTSETTFDGIGINAKNCEFHAAMGLCNLKYIAEILENRKRQSVMYKSLLKDYVRFPIIQNDLITEYNYAYFTIIFRSETETGLIKKVLEKNGIYPRRYFYPSLSSLNYIKQSCATPISDSIAPRILCLPLFHLLSDTTIFEIATIVKNHTNERMQ